MAQPYLSVKELTVYDLRLIYDLFTCPISEACAFNSYFSFYKKELTNSKSDSLVNESLPVRQRVRMEH